MLQIPFLLFVILSSQISLLPAVPNLDPEPALIPPSSLVLSISSPNSGATVPAFPEQSTAAVPCSLDLPPALLHSVSAACSALDSSSLPSRPRCCPALAAWLFSAHSAAGLATRPPPLSSSASTADLPILPDDSESCAAAAEAALRAQGVVLPRPNDTCDVAYCYCGIRLGPLRCPGSFAASASEGRWVVAREDTARSLERDCASPGIGGCARCLKALYELGSEEKEGGGNVTGPGRREGKERDRECQLMGLTWLLAKDRTRYLRTTAFVLRAFMMSPDVDPTSCSLPAGSGGDDDAPLSVDFGLGDGVRLPLPPLSFRLGLFSLLLSLF
ncbi:putative GPI-anchored protein [Cocos nucifera]|uniref:Putative GPI-anchored protein n=1 Tax=Cocos nucifera TaxID=13894 RepID=A0A8K0IBW2_COCNU|nr:putative GPI-anchored protein [Cocos nucifera]